MICESEIVLTFHFLLLNFHLTTPDEKDQTLLCGIETILTKMKCLGLEYTHAHAHLSQIKNKLKKKKRKMFIRDSDKISRTQKICVPKIKTILEIRRIKN